MPKLIARDPISVQIALPSSPRFYHDRRDFELSMISTISEDYNELRPPLAFRGSLELGCWIGQTGRVARSIRFEGSI
jgi:hypothetical protein